MAFLMNVAFQYLTVVFVNPLYSYSCITFFLLENNIYLFIIISLKSEFHSSCCFLKEFVHFYKII